MSVSRDRVMGMEYEAVVGQVFVEFHLVGDFGVVLEVVEAEEA